jgi:putative spermidine/putrescine transport system permease protein
MARSTFQRMLGIAGTLAVLAILGFVILPAAVVTLAAFNDKAILAFPPETWSWRWFAKALA